MSVDYILIKKIKSGDKDACNIFVSKYYEDVLNYCRHHYTDQDFAKDITQETFLRFFEHIYEYTHRGKAKNYLYTIAGNLCRNYYNRKLEISLEQMEERNSLIDNSADIEKIIEKEVIKEIIEKLPVQLRECIILYYFENLKSSEISKRLGISLSLVKYRLRRAKMMLKDILDKE